MGHPGDVALVKSLGFSGVREFQQAAWRGEFLKVDGEIGPRTAKVLALVARDGRLSEHFSIAEMRCPCCKKIRCRAGLLQSLEKYRIRYAPRGLRIVSGYRCPQHNRDVNGAAHSFHMQGAAVDIVPRIGWQEIRDTHWFAGIGVSKGLALHMDRRDIVYPRTSTASRQRPAVWRY